MQSATNIPADERRGRWPAPGCRVLRDTDTDIHILAGGKREAVERACHPTALIDGGQAHEAHELWSQADRLTAILAAPAALALCAVLGIGLAEGFAAVADALGAHVFARFF